MEHSLLRELFVDELKDWIENNPIPFGINWLHSQETALRMQSWIWIEFRG